MRLPGAQGRKRQGRKRQGRKRQGRKQGSGPENGGIPAKQPRAAAEPPHCQDSASAASVPAKREKPEKSLRQGLHGRSIHDRVFGQEGAMPERSQLSRREDLFLQWSIRSWFGNRDDQDEAFRSRLQQIWEELFMALYEDISERVQDKAKRDRYFMSFVNDHFSDALDKYKWYESEKRGHDIGLFTALEKIAVEHRPQKALEEEYARLRALERVALEDWYIELLSRYSEIY
jgi:hypothetical protein